MYFTGKKDCQFYLVTLSEDLASLVVDEQFPQPSIGEVTLGCQSRGQCPGDSDAIPDQSELRISKCQPIKDQYYSLSTNHSPVLVSVNQSQSSISLFNQSQSSISLNQPITVQYSYLHMLMVGLMILSHVMLDGSAFLAPMYPANSPGTAMAWGPFLASDELPPNIS